MCFYFLTYVPRNLGTTYDTVSRIDQDIHIRYQKQKGQEISSEKGLFATYSFYQFRPEGPQSVQNKGTLVYFEQNI